MAASCCGRDIDLIYSVFSQNPWSFPLPHSKKRGRGTFNEPTSPHLCLTLTSSLASGAPQAAAPPLLLLC